MNITDRVREHLKGSDLRKAQGDSVASALCLSGTTLRRRLREEGTTFHALREEERKRRCAEYMAAQGKKAYGKGVAEVLGYAELNSVFRSFRRWYGVDYRDVRAGRVEL